MHFTEQVQQAEVGHMQCVSQVFIFACLPWMHDLLRIWSAHHHLAHSKCYNASKLKFCSQFLTTPFFN